MDFQQRLRSSAKIRKGGRLRLILARARLAENPASRANAWIHLLLAKKATGLFSGGRQCTTAGRGPRWSLGRALSTPRGAYGVSPCGVVPPGPPTTREQMKGGRVASRTRRRSTLDGLGRDAFQPTSCPSSFRRPTREIRLRSPSSFPDAASLRSFGPGRRHYQGLRGWHVPEIRPRRRKTTDGAEVTGLMPGPALSGRRQRAGAPHCLRSTRALGISPAPGFAMPWILESTPKNVVRPLEAILALSAVALWLRLRPRFRRCVAGSGDLRDLRISGGRAAIQTRVGRAGLWHLSGSLG